MTHINQQLSQRRYDAFANGDIATVRRYRRLFPKSETDELTQALLLGSSRLRGTH